MYINKLKKEKNGMYRIDFDSISITLHEDLILKYDLLLKKAIEIEELDLLQEENKKYEIYQNSLKLLKSRMRTRKELMDIFLKKAYDPVIVEEGLKILENQGYLNDDIYAPSFVHDKILLSNDGPYKIQKDLEDKGISSLAVKNALQEFSTELERDRVKKIIQKQIKLNHNKGETFLKKKIQYELFKLGYHETIIQEELYSLSIDDREIAKKEYAKIRAKLERKYKGKELEYKIKQKMYQKGLSYELSE